MGLRVQFKRGASKYVMNHTFDDGEIVINTDTKSLHVGDGETLGGHEIPSKTEIEKIIRNNAISINEDTSMSILALQNDIWGYKADKDYTVGTFVIYNNDLYQCIVANGPASTVANPSNVVYWSQIPTLADLETLVVPTGTVLLYAGTVLPQGYLGCQGAPFDPVTYEKLYNRIGTTYGGTAESPLLPDFRDRYPIGAGTNAVGTYLAEQLPNVNGNVGITVHTTHQSVPFTSNLVESKISFAGNVILELTNMNLSLANSIYTGNGHVYPLSCALNFIIKC